MTIGAALWLLLLVPSLLSHLVVSPLDAIVLLTSDCLLSTFCGWETPGVKFDSKHMGMEALALGRAGRAV